jgi:hypothetical protein
MTTSGRSSRTPRPARSPRTGWSSPSTTSRSRPRRCGMAKRTWAATR